MTQLVPIDFSLIVGYVYTMNLIPFGVLGITI